MGVLKVSRQRDVSFVGSVMADIELAVHDGEGRQVAEAHVPVAPSEGLRKFREAVRKVEGGGRMRRGSQIMFETPSTPADRFAAAVQIGREVARAAPADRPNLLKAIRKKEEGSFDGFADRVVTELYVQSSWTFHLLTPRKLGNHRRWFTWAVAAVFGAIFFYQAGLFPAYLVAAGGLGGDCLADPRVTNAYGLWRWIAPGHDFCVPHTLSADFLIRWGALWMPKLRRQPWRLWTSVAIHQSLWHLATNLFMWLLLASYTERVFGWWRLVLLTFLSATGGVLLTASFGAACTANVGLSGADFGLLGVFIVDLAENVRTSKRAVLRAVMTAILLVLLIVGSVTAPNVSQWAHLGGFLSGIFPSMLVLPRLGHAHVEAWIPIVGAVWTVAYFVSLLSYVFAHRADGLDCGTPDG